MIRPPTISVIIPVWNTDPEFLALCVRSVLDQHYEHWELCLADDGSTRAETLLLLQRLGGVDPRVRVDFGHVHRGISATQNRALAMARGEFVALVDHDDVLDPSALGEVAQVVLRHPDADVIYTDEDQIDTGGGRITILHKPGWSPELLLACAYFNHLTVYRRSLLEAIGGFRTDYVLAQDWDLALRATAVTNRVHHVPRVLYHWRRTPGSAGNFSADGPYWRRRCHEDHVLERFGPDAVSESVWIDGFFWTRRPIQGRPLVSVIIPTAGAKQRLRGKRETLVLNCIRSLLARTDYPEFEVVVVVDPRTPRDVRAELDAIGSRRVRTVAAEGPFHYSARVNLGAQMARGEHLVLLNDDTEVIRADWLRAMLEVSQDPDVGVVGAKLRFPDGSIENCGVAVAPNILPCCPFRGYPGDHPGHLASLTVNRDFSAVTGACQMTRAGLFAELGGYDDGFAVDFGDIDFCLRARALGYRVVTTPRAELMHFEAASRPRIPGTDAERWFARWSEVTDPFWNPLAVYAQDYFLTYPTAASSA